MADVLIVGDGPGGLSAALFLAKNEMDVIVFGQDATLVHKAMLYNYLGIPKMAGSEFQKISREQAEGFGAKILDVEVTGVEKIPGGFAATTGGGDRYEGRYLILASGTNLALAEGLGLDKTGDGIEVDRDCRTAIERVYAVGWSTKMRKIEGIIAAGHGASAALDILSAEAGKEVHDFDVVE